MWTAYDNNPDNANQGYPSSDRIMHDIEKTVKNIKIVHDAKGIAVQGLGNRSGIRYTRKGGWDGSRQKFLSFEENKYKWIHDDAIEAKNKTIEQALMDIDQRQQIKSHILLDEVDYEEDDVVEV